MPKKETKKEEIVEVRKDLDGAVEIFGEDAVITLYDDNNKPIEFFEVASIEYQEKFYELLQPVEKVDGIEDDEAVIFEYFFDEEGEEKLFQPVNDEEILRAVFEIYLKAVADYEFEPSECCG
ncbi:MAG: DUF1292 domain-containing protein [Firmicutes bacterium]|nr:DUF1292 domain-containing protein [Bacillota bacterium]MCL2256265.1 DUF1292 domain-containing protein [Bacillota bacterium]